MLFVWLYRFFLSVLNAIIILQPETVIRWHYENSELIGVRSPAGAAAVHDHSSCYVLVIFRHERRRLVCIGVTSNATAEWNAGQVTDAFP